MTLLVEDGTGLVGAEVYDTTAACAAWLAKRGHAAFPDSSAADQERALLKATEAAERSVGNVIGGVKVRATQGLLLPRTGIYDRSGNYLGHAIPERYRHGIFLLAEAERQGQLEQPSVAASQALKAASAGGMRLEFREPESKPLRERHPEAWALLSSVVGGG